VSRLELATNISIITLAVVAVVAIVDQRILAHRQPIRNNTAAQLVGKKIVIPSVTWDQTPANVQ